MRAHGNEIHVGLHGVTRCRQDSGVTKREIAREAGGFDQAQPLFDAAGIGSIAVVIEDALAPGEAEGRVFASREDGCIFDGDTALIVVAIKRPGLQLAAGELAFMHQQMKWMLVVVALLANGMKAGDELGFGERRLLDVLTHGWIHN